jgi:hypothetical protein
MLHEYSDAPSVAEDDRKPVGMTSGNTELPITAVTCLGSSEIFNPMSSTNGTVVV